MALSGRRISGTTILGSGGSLIVLNETGKSGVLRILKVYSSSSISFTQIRIDVDDVLYADSQVQPAFTSNDYSSVPMGMPIAYNNGSTVNDPYSRLVNIPFTNSIKVTLRSTTVGNTLFYACEYVLDV